MKNRKLACLKWSLGVFFFAFFAFSQPAGAQTTTFQYQGHLIDQGAPANGAYDLQFGLYDALTNGDQIGPILTNSATSVSNGLFLVEINFGNVFDGNNYWLQIAARTNGGGGFTVLFPRQPITSVPYAITAANALNLTGSLPVSQIAGIIPLSQLPSALVTNGAAGLNLSGAFAGSGAGLSAVPAASLTSDTTILSIVLTNAVPSPSTNWAFYPMSQNSSNFLTVGGIISTDSYNGWGYFEPAPIQTGASGQPGFEIASAMSETFGVDGTQFVIGVLGDGNIFDILVNGVDNFQTNTLPAGGNLYWIDINFATAATRTITLRNAYRFLGVYLPITNDFSIPRPLTNRMAVLGDSFTEQAYTSGSQCAGLISQMQSLLPKLDIWGLGEGGTGFVNNGPFGGTNFLARVGDVIRAAPQYVLIYGGINDQSFATNTAVTNPIYVNATNLILTLAAGLPAAKIAVIGPQAPRGLILPGDIDEYNCATLLSNACAVCSVTFINPLSPPWITGDVRVPNTGNADIYTLASDGTHPTVPAGAKYLASQIVSALSSYWNFNNSSSQSTTGLELITNGVPTPVPGVGILWNSNNALYWVTTTHTNYVSGP
jgi:lysophospholipase L1-like esterase